MKTNRNHALKVIIDDCLGLDTFRSWCGFCCFALPIDFVVIVIDQTVDIRMKNKHEDQHVEWEHEPVVHKLVIGCLGQALKLCQQIATVWFYKLKATNALNGTHQGCNHKHGCQVDHDLVWKIVHLKEEGQKPDQNQEEGLQKRIGQMVLCPSFEQDVNHGLAVVSILCHASGHLFIQDVILNEFPFSWKIRLSKKGSMVVKSRDTYLPKNSTPKKSFWSSRTSLFALIASRIIWHT